MFDGSLFGKEKNYQNLSLDTNELVNQLIMSCSLKSSMIQLLELTMFSNRSKTCLSYMRLQGVYLFIYLYTHAMESTKTKSAHTYYTRKKKQYCEEI